MSRNNKPQTDPRGHSLRIYSDVYDSAAFRALSPHDVMAYLALLRELKGYNNGNLSLPLTRAKNCGIGHHMTLARSLRALCAVGLVAVTRKGGCTKGGQRLPNLYRLTDRECYEVPKLFLEAMNPTNEWKRFKVVEQAQEAITKAEKLAIETHAKKNNLGHAETATRTRRDVVGAKTRSSGDVWKPGLGHAVTMAENPAKPMPIRVSTGFDTQPEKASHRTRRVPPLYLYQSNRAKEHGNYKRLTATPIGMFTNLIH